MAPLLSSLRLRSSRGHPLPASEPARTTRYLPSELVVEILTHAYGITERLPTSFSDWPAVYRQKALLPPLLVCRAWYDGGVALLYRTPYLPSVRSLQRFARTLSRHPDLARIVRGLVLGRGLPPPRFTRTLASRLRGRADNQQERAEAERKGWLHAIFAACENVNEVCFLSMHDADYLPAALKVKGGPHVIPLRRLTLLDGDNIVLYQPIPFVGIAPGRPRATPKTGLILEMSKLEELNIASCRVYDHDETVSHPFLRIVRVSHTMLLSPKPILVIPPYERAQGLVAIDLRENGGSGYPAQCTECIQSHAGNLQELTLIGWDELVIFQSLKLEAFHHLWRLAIGYLEADHSGFEQLDCIPPSVQLLVAHWQNNRSALCFRHAEFMITFLKSDAEIHQSRRAGKRMSVRVLGRAPEALQKLCGGWTIDLLECNDGDDFQLFHGEKREQLRAVVSLGFTCVVVQY